MQKLNFDIQLVDSSSVRGIHFVEDSAKARSIYVYGAKAAELFDKLKTSKADYGYYTIIEKTKGAFQLWNTKEDGIEVVYTCKLSDTYKPDNRIVNFCYPVVYEFEGKWYPVSRDEVQTINPSEEGDEKDAWLVSIRFDDGVCRPEPLGYVPMQDLLKVVRFKPFEPKK